MHPGIFPCLPQSCRWSRPLPRLSACASWICFFPIIVRPLRWSVFSFSGRKCRSHKSRWHLRTDIDHCMPGPNRVARWGHVSWRRFPGTSRLLRVRRFPGNIHRTIGCNFHYQVVSWRVSWKWAWLLRILPSRTRLWLLPGFVRKLLCSKGRIERKGYIFYSYWYMLIVQKVKNTNLSWIKLVSVILFC